MSRSRCAAVLAVALLGCGHDPPPPAASDVQFLKLFSRGADDASPLLVVLHGRGGTADRFARFWRDLPAKLEVAVAEAPAPYAHGREWYRASPTMTDHDFAVAVGDAEAKLWPAIAALAHGRKILVAGFSQGANLAYLMATRHPDAIAYAFPISGHLAPELVPTAGARLAPIYAVHGADDPIIPVAGAQHAIAALQALGGKAELHEFPGVGHTITPEMHDDVVNHIVALVARP